MLLINFLLFHQFIDGIERLCLRQSRNKIKHVNTLSYGSRGKISTKKNLYVRECYRCHLWNIVH